MGMRFDEIDGKVDSFSDTGYSSRTDMLLWSYQYISLWLVDLRSLVIIWGSIADNTIFMRILVII